MASNFQQLVSGYARLARTDLPCPSAEAVKVSHSSLSSNAPKVLLFSPHPDDEVITGGLALRLQRESNWKVVNVAVTLGSKRERRSERANELKACCDAIGFELFAIAPEGLENVHVRRRKKDPASWSQSVKVIADLLAEQGPRAIFLPHKADWNSTHIGTHWLVMDALKILPPEFNCFIVETEFWQPMDSPNLMVEISGEDLADLITALSCHAGELARNPYHLSLPAWMIDNVRRGAELVGGQGGTAPQFPFATLYRLGHWSAGRLKKSFRHGKILNAGDDPGGLFNESIRAMNPNHSNSANSIQP